MYCVNCGSYLQPIYRFCTKCGTANSKAVTLYPPKSKFSKKDLLAWQKIVIANSPDRLICNRSQLESATTMAAQRRLEIIKDSQQLVNNTVNPDTYFERFDLLYEHLLFLLQVEPYFSFVNGSPSQSIAHLCQSEELSNKAFIERYYQAVSEKAQVLKTAKGKLNRYQKFYDSLKPYFRRLSSSNIAYIEQLYQSAIKKVDDNKTLVDKRVSNRQRIQKDLNDCLRLGTDLVTISAHPSCPVCSKYKGVVYSISGTNKRYPILPTEVIQQTHSCPIHAMSLNMFFEGISTLPRK